MNIMMRKQGLSSYSVMYFIWLILPWYSQAFIYFILLSNNTMKKYPKQNWQELDPISQKKMDKYEKVIKQYLDTWLGYSNDVQAYNLAFLILQAE